MTDTSCQEPPQPLFFTEGGYQRDCARDAHSASAETRTRQPTTDVSLRASALHVDSIMVPKPKIRRQSSRKRRHTKSRMDESRVSEDDMGTTTDTKKLPVVKIAAGSGSFLVDGVEIKSQPIRLGAGDPKPEPPFELFSTARGHVYQFVRYLNGSMQGHVFVFRQYYRRSTRYTVDMSTIVYEESDDAKDSDDDLALDLSPDFDEVFEDSTSLRSENSADYERGYEREERGLTLTRLQSASESPSLKRSTPISTKAMESGVGHLTFQIPVFYPKPPATDTVKADKSETTSTGNPVDMCTIKVPKLRVLSELPPDLEHNYESRLVVLKVFDTRLIEAGISKKGNHVYENVASEVAIHRLVCSWPQPQSHGFVRFFEDCALDEHYIVAMEYCAKGELLEHVVRLHQDSFRPFYAMQNNVIMCRAKFFKRRKLLHRIDQVERRLSAAVTPETMRSSSLFGGVPIVTPPPTASSPCSTPMSAPPMSGGVFTQERATAGLLAGDGSSTTSLLSCMCVEERRQLSARLRRECQMLHQYFNQLNIKLRNEQRPLCAETAYSTHIRRLFSQLVTTVFTLHRRGVLHLDISLENLLLDDFGHVKLCDFGRAEMFQPKTRATTTITEETEEIEDGRLLAGVCREGHCFTTDEQTELWSDSTVATFEVDCEIIDPNICPFLSLTAVADASHGDYYSDAAYDFKLSKWMGKTKYMSPEAYAHVKASVPQTHYSEAQRLVCTEARPYDGALGEVWSLGCVLFMMLTGACPVRQPHADDKNFVTLMTRGVRALLYAELRTQFVSESALDLLAKIFQFEDRRICMVDLMRHPFVCDRMAMPSTVSASVPTSRAGISVTMASTTRSGAAHHSSGDAMGASVFCDESESKRMMKSAPFLAMPLPSPAFSSRSAGAAMRMPEQTAPRLSKTKAGLMGSPLSGSMPMGRLPPPAMSAGLSGVVLSPSLRPMHRQSSPPKMCRLHVSLSPSSSASSMYGPIPIVSPMTGAYGVHPSTSGGSALGQYFGTPFLKGPPSTRTATAAAMLQPPPRSGVLGWDAVSAESHFTRTHHSYSGACLTPSPTPPQAIIGRSPVISPIDGSGGSIGVRHTGVNPLSVFGPGTAAPVYYPRGVRPAVGRPQTHTGAMSYTQPVHGGYPHQSREAMGCAKAQFLSPPRVASKLRASAHTWTPRAEQ